MMLLPCPHCGLRNEDEFICLSEALPQRPENPASLSDDEWVDYVYNHKNPKGWSTERWFHVRGCSRWVVVERHTVTPEVRVLGESHVE